MESLTIQFEQLAASASADEKSRMELLIFVESIVQKLESPAEKLHRISMAVRSQLHSIHQVSAMLMPLIGSSSARRRDTY